jgi:hypothetical protein
VKKTVVALLIGLIAPMTAHAGAQLGAHMDFGAPLGGGPKIGKGIGGHFGYKLGVPFFTATPQLRFTHFIGSKTSVPAAGGQLMFGKFVMIGAYVHGLVAMGPAFEGPTPGLDLGGALDITAIPKIDIGGHAGLLFTNDSGDAAPDKNFIAGFHLALNF